MDTSVTEPNEVSLPGSDSGTLRDKSIVLLINQPSDEKSKERAVQNSKIAVELEAHSYEVEPELILEPKGTSFQTNHTSTEDIIDDLDEEKTILIHQCGQSEIPVTKETSEHFYEQIKVVANKLIDEIEEEATAKVYSVLNAVPNVTSDYLTISTLIVPENDIANHCTENELKVIDLPTIITYSDEEDRKNFIESLPEIQNVINENKVYKDCKRDFYQSLKKYFVDNNHSKPPIPLQTYRWEDLKRAKERGGYPWTHIYKRPLKADEEPEIILLLRKSQEINFPSDTGSGLNLDPEDDQNNLNKRFEVSIVDETTELQNQINDSEHLQHLQNQINDSEHLQHLEDLEDLEDDEKSSLRCDSISCISDTLLLKKTSRLSKIKRFMNRRNKRHAQSDIQSLPDEAFKSSSTSLEQKQEQESKSLTDSTSPKNKQKKRHSFTIMKKLKTLADRQKKKLNIKCISLRGSEKIKLAEETKIIKLKSSPKSERSEIPHFVEKQDSDDILDIIELDESPSHSRKTDLNLEDESTNVPIQPDEIIELSNKNEVEPQLLKNKESSDQNIRESLVVSGREHVYEEISTKNEVLDLYPIDVVKKSLQKQDNCVIDDIEVLNNEKTLDRMGSSEEDPNTNDTKNSSLLLAPISSIDSTSSDEDRNRVQLETVNEESDRASEDIAETSKIDLNNIKSDSRSEQLELKSAIKKESSPAPSDKKVTFSNSEKEDIEICLEKEEEEEKEKDEEPVSKDVAISEKWKGLRDNEYEPIGDSNQPDHFVAEIKEEEFSPHKIEVKGEKELEEASSFAKKENINSMDLNENVESAVKDEEKNVKKGFLATAQSHTRKMQISLKNQANKLKTRLHPEDKSSLNENNDVNEDAPTDVSKPNQFPKFKMPEIKRPDMSKLKGFKRPNFTKIGKPSMPKIKIPEKLSNIKLRRSNSLKQEANKIESLSDDKNEENIKESSNLKRGFDFKFGTYPRAFHKKKKPLAPEPSLSTDETSPVPSNLTQPSFKSSNSPQGDRGPGPVRSFWADKFSDVSYNDSEGSRYRRYGSELDSFDKESSPERQIKEDLVGTDSESRDIGILGGVSDTKQFQEFNEENRAIHEISTLRAGEFKRRPIVHQDSDLRSEDSKDAIGWTEKEIEKNKLLRRAEMESEESYIKYYTGDPVAVDAQSTSSSSRKVVMEEINDDEFFLRKRGISEDNADLRQYISSAIRGDVEMPINGLDHVGRSSSGSMRFEEYDIPPPKPKRLLKETASEKSEETETQSQDFNSNIIESKDEPYHADVPKKPMRKDRFRHKKNKENFRESTEFDGYIVEENENKNNILFYASGPKEYSAQSSPQPPLRRKNRQSDFSLEKDSILNSFDDKSLQSSEARIFSSSTDPYLKYESSHPTLDDDYRFISSETGSYNISNFDKNDLDKSKNEEEEEQGNIFDSTEADGYAVVRKDQFHKPTPPTRRKKYLRAPGEHFATLPNRRLKQHSPPPRRPPPPRSYTPSRKSTQSLNTDNTFEDYYEEPDGFERPESPRDLQSGEIVSKMKYRPLPPPPRPPREKRLRQEKKSFTNDEDLDLRYKYLDDFENLKNSEYEESIEETEAATQTDPLPDDFVVADLEITENMRLIEPTKIIKTVDDYLKSDSDPENISSGSLEDQQIDRLARSLQKFREANQRSISERSRASSQTPSAIVIEQSKLSTTSLNKKNESLLESKLIVKPIEISSDDERNSYKEGSYTHDTFELKLDNYKMLNEDNTILNMNLTDSETMQQSKDEEDNVIDIKDYKIESTLLDDLATEDTETLDEKGFIDVIEEMRDPKTTNETSEIDMIDDIIDSGERMSSIEKVETIQILGSSFNDEESSAAKSNIVANSNKMNDDVEKIQEEETSKPFDVNDMEKEIRDVNVGLTQPLPPPRRKSSTVIDSENSTKLTEQLTPEAKILDTLSSGTQTSNDISELAVERLQVRALQAGQLLVQQLHGSQISTDQLESNTTNLVVSNIQLPPGFIEDIVARVRNTDKTQSSSVETQTSTQDKSNLSEPQPIKYSEPIDPPLSPISICTEETQTDISLGTLTTLIEQRPTPNEINNELSENRDMPISEGNNSTSSQSALTTGPMSITEASQQLVSACSLSLVNIINQLTEYVRPQQVNDPRVQQLSTVVALFVLICLVIMLLILSGKRLHTHHWDFFNLPGHEARR